MYSARVVTSLEEFHALESPWEHLLKQTACDNIFLTWEWLYTWAVHYLDGNRLWIILVYKGKDHLVGIAPFYIQRGSSLGILSVRELRFLGTGEVCSSYLDFIVPEGEKRSVLECIYSHLHGEAASEWDTLTLAEVPAESSTIDLWEESVQQAGRLMEIVGTTVCPVIQLTGELEDFLGTIGGNERYNLQRKRKRLEQVGHVTYQRVSSSEETEGALDTFIRLHEMRWEQKGPGGVFRSGRFLSFQRDIVRLFAKKGWVYLDFLLLDGEAIAGIYGYGYNRRYSFYLPGFNPTIAPRASPGIILLFQCVKEAISGNYKEFDLLRGLADYKRAWANGLRRSLTLRYYNRDLRAAAVKLVESGKAVAKVLVR